MASPLNCVDLKQLQVPFRKAIIIPTVVFIKNYYNINTLAI
jgi:hypothetical protein